MREYQLWRTILVVMSGLLFSSLAVIPYKDLPIHWAAEKEVFYLRIPFYWSNLLLVVYEVIQRGSRQANIPHMQIAWVFSTSSKQIFTEVRERNNKQLIFRCLLALNKLLGSSNVPKFEVAVWRGSSNKIRIKTGEFSIINVILMSLFYRNCWHFWIQSVPDTDSLTSGSNKHALLLRTPT